MTRHSLHLSAAIAVLFPFILVAQDESPDVGQITGNVQMLFQTYQEDSLIGAQVPPSKTGFNAFGNLIYTRGGFSAGMRYESYLDPILGYPGRFRGSGIGYRYLNYNKEHFEVTVGNFYEQFGSGLVLRAYEERQLGIDNALDGFRLVLRPAAGVTVKGLVGKQRFDFDSRLINSPGIIRAFDGEVNLNDAIESWATAGTRITLGASFVSRFQTGSTISKDTLILELPQNVGSWGYRAQVQKGGFQLMGEYVRKINDPNADNGYTYRDGEGILVNAGWSTKGLGINVGFKGVDNMQFRSDRNLQLFDLPVNYIPAITKQHTYNLAATLYPYATVVQGEVGWSAEVFYTIPTKEQARRQIRHQNQLSIRHRKQPGHHQPERGGWARGRLPPKQLESGRGPLHPGHQLRHQPQVFQRVQSQIRLFPLRLQYPRHSRHHGLQRHRQRQRPRGGNPGPHQKGHSLRTELQALFTGTDMKEVNGEMKPVKQDKGDWATVLAEYSDQPPLVLLRARPIQLRQPQPRSARSLPVRHCRPHRRRPPLVRWLRQTARRDLLHRGRVPRRARFQRV